MANVLTAITPQIYEALQIVPRESVGMARGCYINSDLERAAQNQTITYPLVPTMSAADVTPAATSSTGTDQTIAGGSMTLDKFRKVSWNWRGEEMKALMTGDKPQYQDARRLQFTQAFRAIANEVENDLWVAAYKGASRAYGTAGTTPFGTANDFSDFANLRNILVTNGAPPFDLHLGLGHEAITNIQAKQSSLFKANEAGSDELLRTGSIGNVLGFAIHESHPITTVTKGTGTSYQTNGSTLAVGATDIVVDTGSGTILAGDIITAAGDTNKYVVNSALASNSLSIGRPGLRSTLADNVALTVGNNAVRNIGFHRNALHLVMRPPSVFDEGDLAASRTLVRDPISGLVFDVAVYIQYYQISIEVSAVWGVEAVMPEFIAVLLG